MYSRDLPYNELPPIPWSQLETRTTLKAALETTRVLESLRSAGPLIPNQAILLRSMLLQEARASSEVENIVTTNDALYRAIGASGEEPDPQTKEVLRYADALWEGFRALQAGADLDPELILRIGRTIVGPSLDFRDVPGCHVRNVQTGEVIYTPPTGRSRIVGMLADLCDFMANPGDTEPLIAVAAAHRQFEAIHPFPDGNGRTGRILNILWLVKAGRMEWPILYLSGHLLRNRPAYYRHLREVTETANWQDWILFMLRAMERTASETLEMLHAVRSALDAASDLARDRMVRGYSRELLEVVFSQPYTRIAHVTERGIAKPNTASVYLRDLERIGIVQGVRIGREVLFRNEAFLRALSLSQTNA